MPPHRPPGKRQRISSWHVAANRAWRSRRAVICICYFTKGRAKSDYAAFMYCSAASMKMRLVPR